MKLETELKRATAADLMQKDLVQVEADAPIAQAIEVLETNGISGAPVVENGRLMGVLSARDVARSEHVREGRISTEGRDYDLAETDAEDPWDEERSFVKDDYSPRVLDGKTVRDWMNADVISVAPTDSLQVVCSTFVNEKVHRVLVVEDHKLVGLISTFDLARFLAARL